MYENLAVLAGFVFIYSLVAGRVERMPLSGPIVFMVFGLVCGPLGLGLLKLEAETLPTLAELTLALVLFTDAANAKLEVLKRNLEIPQRLLLIGLPLSILLGFGVAVSIFDGLTLFALAILATMLAPTDAALGEVVVTNPAVPGKIRESLNVESGLNDGICVPILFVFLALATGGAGDGGTLDLALRLVAEEIGIGLAVGLGLAFIGSWLLKPCAEGKWITETWAQLPVIGLALLCFAVAQLLGGSGFIGSFSGGMLFGTLTKRHKEDLLRAAEGTGDTLALATWVLFGAGVVGQSIGHFSWQILLYAVLSLTLIRMLPVYLVMAGLGMKADTKLFLGWFGPRGLASIVFAVMVLNEGVPGAQTLAMAVVCTVFLSILAHGLSANPLVNEYVRRR